MRCARLSRAATSADPQSASAHIAMRERHRRFTKDGSRIAFQGQRGVSSVISGFVIVDVWIAVFSFDFLAISCISRSLPSAILHKSQSEEEVQGIIP